MFQLINIKAISKLLTKPPKQATVNRSRRLIRWFVRYEANGRPLAESVAGNGRCFHFFSPFIPVVRMFAIVFFSPLLWRREELSIH